MQRYFITRPVEGGYAWWNVCDSESPLLENFAVVTIYKGVPDAEEEAKYLCDKLNGE